MTDLIPAERRLTISRTAGAIPRQKLEKLEHLLILAPVGLKQAAWKKLPRGEQLLRLHKRIGNKQAVPAAQTTLGKGVGTTISIGLLGEDIASFARLEAVRRLLAHALTSNPARLGVLVTGFGDDATATAVAAAGVAAALAAVAPLPAAKRKRPRRPRLRSLQLYGDGDPDLARLRAENSGNHLARWLTAQPPNRLDSAAYRRAVAELAGRYGWKMTFLDRDALARAGAGAFLAVAQAGDTDAGIVHLQYRPGTEEGPADLCLVGKGICFDTGGVNLKAAQHMQNMHDDMQGSAVALGVLTALTRLKSDLRVDCWLAISENLIGASAYKPMDVVTAVDGTTIEIIHTDAEGRMVLADTLALAAREKPRIVIDYATLTGACVHALGGRYSGGFTNRSDLNSLIVAAGTASGERVWPFPMDDDFDGALRSEYADTKQCSLDGGGDHILAARFLGRFVGKRPWIHIDLSTGRHKGGLGHIASDVTGFGVRFTLNLLVDQALLERIPS